jgi:hypothetical protein
MWSDHHISHEMCDNGGDELVIGRLNDGEFLLDVVELSKTSGNPGKICFG